MRDTKNEWTELVSAFFHSWQVEWVGEMGEVGGGRFLNVDEVSSHNHIHQRMYAGVLFTLSL